MEGRFAAAICRIVPRRPEARPIATNTNEAGAWRSFGFSISGCSLRQADSPHSNRRRVCGRGVDRRGTLSEIPPSAGRCHLTFGRDRWSSHLETWIFIYLVSRGIECSPDGGSRDRFRFCFLTADAIRAARKSPEKLPSHLTEFLTKPSSRRFARWTPSLISPRRI